MVDSVGAQRIEELLQPYLRRGTEVPTNLYDQLLRYLDLLVKWNARTNLTSIREPEQIVRRHFGESLFAGQHLNSFEGKWQTLLDFGSGAGFPGIPMQLLRPELRVTLAESQNKKATFLREAVRTLGLATEVWGDRVEAMAAGRQFDVVAMRAVDDMETALEAAATRAASRLMVLSTDRSGWKLPQEFDVKAVVAMASSENQHVLILERRLTTE